LVPQRRSTRDDERYAKNHSLDNHARNSQAIGIPVRQKHNVGGGQLSLVATFLEVLPDHLHFGMGGNFRIQADYAAILVRKILHPLENETRRHIGALRQCQSNGALQEIASLLM
ncbi:MAG: hypothetical protein ACK56I_05665, partial [bacterium]